MKLYFQDKTFCLSVNQDLTLYEGDSDFLKHNQWKYPILRARWRVNKHGDPIFILHFFNVRIINVNYAKFQKKFDSRTIWKELL